MSAEEIIEKFKKSFQTPSRKDERLKVVLICVAISTTFWFFSALNKDNYVSQISFPISISYDKEAYIATKPLPERLTLEVSGGGWDLMTRSFGFNMETLDVYVERPDSRPFVLVSSLRSEIAANLEPVVINYIPNDSIKFDIQRKVEKTVPVAVDESQVRLDNNYRILEGIRVRPDSVLLTGPEETLASIEEILVTPNVRGVDADYSGTITLENLPEFVTANTKEIGLSFPVVRYLKITESFPVQKKNFPIDAIDFEPKRLDVTYAISELEFDATDSTELELTVDFNNFDPADSTIYIEVEKRNPKIDNVTFTPLRVKLIKND
ncbi:CdaR family protein [Roseivirga pacifica]|uniref:CdaR family protein n=1 Tax=Roseivirga pacifica TaxID=1267423 RepID=UPI003BAB6CEE